MTGVSSSLWNIKDIIILQFIALFLGFLAFRGQIFLISDTHLLAPMFHIFIYFFKETLLLGLLLYWYFFLYELPGEYFGLTFFNFRKSFLPTLKVMVPVILMLIIFVHIPLDSETAGNFSPLMKIQGLPSGIISLLYLFFFTILFLIPACGMEILYRGFVGIYLENKMGRVLGGVSSALYFALFLGPWHLEWFFLNAFLGLLLFHMFRSKKTIWPGIFFMASFRSALLIYVFGWNFLLL